MTILLIITILLFVAYAALLVYYRRAWVSNDEYRDTDGADYTNYTDWGNDEVGVTNDAMPSAWWRSAPNDEYRDTDGADYTNYTDGGNDEVRMKNDEFADAPIQHSSFIIQHSTFVIPLTVIIPARNEEANIGRCLQSIVDQSYPAHLRQIIVADDFSTDGTADIVRSFEGQNVSLLRLADHVTDRLNSYKKKAIELAVGQASGTLIITTDADCIVLPGWLATYAAFYQEHSPAFIAAPVAINCNNRPIEIFQALDFMTLQGITGASVYKKIHTMCNGANMAYERSAFYEVGGFTGIDHIASGDDMLLMHKIYQRYPDRVLFLKSKNAIVQTEPVHTVKEFLNQRIRWASKADKYEDKRIFWVLVLVYLFNVLMLALPIVICLMSYGLRAVGGEHGLAVTGSQFPIPNTQFQIPPITVWLLLLCSKTIIELYFLYPVAQFFNNTKLLWWFPIAQPFHILYTVIAGWLGKFGSYHWKGRKVR